MCELVHCTTCDELFEPIEDKETGFTTGIPDCPCQFELSNDEESYTELDFN